jgi:hypothetical protein
MAISRAKIKPMIYNYLFKVSKDAGIKMNFNSVEYVEETFETPLDYLDNVIAGKTPIIIDPVLKKYLERLRGRLVKRFDAKNFKSLPPMIRSQYKENILNQ